MDKKLNMNEIVNMMTAINSYHNMINYISSLEKNNDKLKAIHAKLVEPSKNNYIDQNSEYIWQNIDLHVICQLWSNTSCGWEGIGGCAMSHAYTTIIENLQLNAAFVYYNGELAYISEIDDKFITHKMAGFKNLPGMLYCEKDLNIIYRKSVIF